MLAYTIFGRGSAKQTAPGAIIIHFLGGIHEIYFPYILMKPILILSAIGGGMAGVMTFSLFNAGLVAPASPGSIFAILAMTPRDGYLGVFAGIIVATVVSFAISAVVLKTSKVTDTTIEAASEKASALKGRKTVTPEVQTSFSTAEKMSDTVETLANTKKLFLRVTLEWAQVRWAHLF